MKIKNLILEGEGITLDFKKTITSCEKIARTMVSFANNIGGRLLVGVFDDGTINGVKSEEEEKYMLIKAAHFFCKPVLEPVFEEVCFDDKIILIVEIKKSDVKPHFALGEDQKWRPYIRINDKSVFASKTFINVLKRENKKTEGLLNYSLKEKYLLEYLQKNERITAKEYSSIVNLSQYRSNQILVNLTLSGIIKIHTTEKEEFYTAS